MKNLMLTIAHWLLPEGYRIIVPGTEIVAPLEPDHTRFIVTTEGRYLREGKNHYYCPRHDWQFIVGEGDTPQCISCRGDAFKAAAEERRRDPLSEPIKRDVTSVMKQRFREQKLERKS